MTLFAEVLGNWETLRLVDGNPADQQLAQRVRDSLVNGKYRELREITCNVHEGCVILTGVVKSYWLKQLAQTEIQLVPGVGLIQNKILVTGQ